MANSYQVRLYNQAEGIDQTIDVSEESYILETAEEQGMELPYSCRQGVCASCAVKTLEGTVDQTESTYLSEDQIAEGYVLICIARPQSNCVFETHKNEEVLT